MKRKLSTLLILTLILVSTAKLPAQDYILCIEKDNTIKIELAKVGQCCSSFTQQIMYKVECSNCVDIAFDSVNNCTLDIKELKNKIHYIVDYNFNLLQNPRLKINSVITELINLKSIAIILKSTVLRL